MIGTLLNTVRFSTRPSISISQFFIRATSSGADSAQPHLEGLIPVTITESTQCQTFVEKSGNEDILNPSFEKEQVKISFIIGPELGVFRTRRNAENSSLHDNFIIKELESKLTSVFNSISLVDQISFLQIRELEKEDVKRGQRGLGCSAETKCQIIDIQMILVKNDIMNKGKSLNDSVTQGTALKIGTG